MGDTELEEILAGLGASGFVARQRAVERAGAFLRGHPSGRQVDRVAAGLEPLAHDGDWQVRAAVASAAAHLGRHKAFDAIVGFLENDPQDFVKQAATRARTRRRMSVRGTDLDEIEEVEAQFDRLEAEHGKKLAAGARELALAYLSAVVGEAVHDAKTFKIVLTDSHKKLRKTLGRRNVPESEWDEELADADRRARVMFAMIEDMALYANSGTSAFERVNLVELINTAIRDVRQYFKERGQAKRYVDVTVQVDPTLALDAPRDLLARALTNVIKNAMEAVSPDDGYVGIAAEADESDDGRVTLVVTDDGPGFPKGEDPRRYLLPGVSTKKGKDGSENSGWGLTVTRRIIERDCRGWLDVGNGEGLGAVVTFELPLRREDEAS
jgi:signal transduction histidine kinase